MSIIEDYFFSSCDTEQIEKVFLGAVLSNDNMELTAEEKETARNNIGAGTENRNFVINGYYETMAELPEFPSVGEAYGVGYEEPYDIFVWDSVHNQWVNIGPIATSTNIIDDTSNDNIHALSSFKIYDMLDELQVDTSHIEDDSISADKIVNNAVSINAISVIAKKISDNDISPWVATPGGTGAVGYMTGDIVSYDSSLYISIADDNMSAPDDQDWDPYIEPEPQPSPAPVYQEWVQPVGAPYIQEITVSGILASDYPIIDVIPSAVNYSLATDQVNAWAEIYRIETLTNGGGLKVYAHYPTSTDISIRIICVRK